MTTPGSNEKPVVIVTGSSGLIGGAVINELRHDYQVVGFDRDGEPQPPPEVECVCVDLTDDDSVRLGVDRVRYAYGERVAGVVHLAAYYDFSGEPSELYEEVTVRGTGRLLAELKSMDVELFLFSSTMLVHRPGEPGRPITEETRLEGRWDYPQSKIDTEALIRRERGDIPAVLMRIAGVYTDRCDSIPLAHQMQRIYEKRLTSHLYPGDTTHGQAFVHLDDVVRAIGASIERRGRLPEEVAVLVGEPETMSYGELQRELGRRIHGEEDWSTREIPKSVAKSGAWVKGQIPGSEEPFIKPWMVEMADDHYELSIERARKLLGWSPEHRLAETLPRMVEALKSDPARWYEQHGLEPIPEPTSQPDELAHLPS